MEENKVNVMENFKELTNSLINEQFEVGSIDLDTYSSITAGMKVIADIEKAKEDRQSRKETAMIQTAGGVVQGVLQGILTIVGFGFNRSVASMILNNEGYFDKAALNAGVKKN